MDEYILRNDPCFCGSGKRFKICHMNSAYTKEYFDVHVNPSTPRGSTTAIFRNGKWEQIPRISLDMTLYVVDPKYDYTEINEVISPLSRRPDLIESQRRLRHKLCAVRYHLDNFRREEDDWINRYRTSIEGGESCNVVEENPKIIYEVESFLFQVKSCLDVLNVIIRIALKLPYGHSYSNGGQQLISSLEYNCPKDLEIKATNLIRVLKSNKKWILHEVDLRDEVTHESDLTGFEYFSQQGRSGNIFRVYYPSMPNGMKVRTFVDGVWKKLLVLNKDTIMEIVS